MESEYSWPVIGHKNVIEFLQKSIEADRISHAYLFSGPNHLGKSLVAKHFIQSLLCQNSNVLPCNNCSTCNDFNRGIYPDFYKIVKEEGKKNISVEQVRDLRYKISNSSFLGNYRIVLITEAQNLSLSAANSLLKILEEPGKKTVFILLSDNLEQIPLTIKSRCQTINFNPVDIDEVFEHLSNQGIDSNLSKEISFLTHGRPGLAINYADDIHIFDKYKSLIIEFLGVLNHPIGDRFGYLDKEIGKEKVFQKKSVLAEAILDQWLIVFRDLLLVKNFSFDIVANIFAIDKLKALSGKYQEKRIILFIDRINKAKKYLRNSVNPQLTLENLILNF